jgi:DNA-directed RNA polymerase III subunit RPC1
MEGRTLRFNECVCAPYNADFDGDEMNIHFPQTIQAQAEIRTLMNVSNNILTPKSGAPIISPTQDFLTSSFMITHKDNFFDRSTFCRLLGQVTGCETSIKIPTPSIIFP